MQRVICSFSQKRVVTVRHIDEGTIAGRFSLVDWQQLDAIAATVEQLLRDLDLIDAGCVEVGQALRGVPGTSAMFPSVVIWGGTEVSSETARMIDSVLEKFAQSLKPSAPSTQGDLCSGDEPPAALTPDRLQTIDGAGAGCAKLLGRSIRHSISFENADARVVAVAEGALRPPASMLVGKDSTRHVRAIVDLLGFGDFSVRLITDDGDGIDGHYESHEDFAALAEQLQNRETHSFEVVTRIDDRGKSRNVVRLSSRSQ